MRGAFDPRAVHERPVGRTKILDRELTVGTPRDAGMTPGDLGVAAEASLVLRRQPADQQVGIDADQLPLLLALSHPQLFASHHLEA